MQSKYSPVQIRNPLSRGHLVRLYPGQRLSVAFTKPEFKSSSLHISGPFLSLDELEATNQGWTAHISQAKDCAALADVTLFLGEVYIVGDGMCSSLCVVMDSPNADYMRVIQPANNTFRLEPHQLLDVLFYSPDYGDEWFCDIISGQLRLEQIDHRAGPLRHAPEYMQALPLCGGLIQPVEEHYFRFRLDAHSVETVQALPEGKYDGGALMFRKNGNREASSLNIVLNWKERKRNEVYKALLLPKNSQPVWRHYPKQRRPKQAMQAKVVVRRIECADIDSGCKVIWSKSR